MKPKKSAIQDRQQELFRVELSRIIDHGHSLIKLAAVVEWDQLEKVFGETYCPDNGRAAISTRLMVALHYLKYTHNLSDDDVVAGWVENPYWQYFSGMKYFEHEVPIHPSSMTRWRKRIGEAGAEQLLKQTLEAGLKLNAIKQFQLKRINVDTTVQEKEVRFPADARLYDRARHRIEYFKTLEIQYPPSGFLYPLPPGDLRHISQWQPVIVIFRMPDHGGRKTDMLFRKP
jgi:IS5 family transposase